MTDTSDPDPPPPPEAPRTPEPPPAPEAPPLESIASHTPPAGPPAARPPWLPILIGVAVIALVVAGFAIWRAQFAGPSDEPVVVQPYTPETELISARERVPGYEQPDGASPVAVEFGAGVTLMVTGRVARGLAGDWYAVTWSERTVFVRTTDAVVGSGAPPAPIIRERKPEEEEEEEEDKPDDELDEDEEPVSETPFPSTGALGMGDVRWMRAPNARDFARFYPDRALDDGQSGQVTLDCIIGGGGRLACSVASEDPNGYGFGRAAINISRQLRVDTTLPDGGNASGRNLIVPLVFRAG